jgi:hypothetical protein
MVAPAVLRLRYDMVTPNSIRSYQLLTDQSGVTKMQTMPKKSRAKPGPKPKPQASKVVKKTVSLQPETFRFLIKKGKGVLSAGIEAAVGSARKK